MSEKKEYILCSAIWFDDNIEHNHQPKNIKTGYVICGRRHHNCFSTMWIMNSGNNSYLQIEKEQGFLTNQDRFVGRKEGAKIAFQSGQIKEEKKRLYSEDLW